jgi:hypothetical protein
VSGVSAAADLISGQLNRERNFEKAKTNPAAGKNTAGLIQK